MIQHIPKNITLNNNNLNIILINGKNVLTNIKTNGNNIIFFHVICFGKIFTILLTIPIT